MDNGYRRFPSSRYLRVPFVFVPKGSPRPLEWIAAHPRYVTISGFYTPPPEPTMGLEPQPGAEGQAEPSPKTPVCDVVIDYAGKWTIRPVEPLTPQAAPWTEPLSSWPTEAQPGKWPVPPTQADPATGPMLDPHPRDVRAGVAAMKAAVAAGDGAEPTPLAARPLWPDPMWREGGGNNGLLPGLQLASFDPVLSRVRVSRDPNVIPAAGTKNTLVPEPQAVGPHSTFRRAPDGSIHNYETYEQSHDW